MASLEDFFAKKDKKKPKIKPNYLAADELYRTLEEASKLPDAAASKVRLSEEQSNCGGGGGAAMEAPTIVLNIRFADVASGEDEVDWCELNEKHRHSYTDLMPLTLVDEDFKTEQSSSKSNMGLTNSLDVAATASVGDGLCAGLQEATCPWQKQKSLESESPPFKRQLEQLSDIEPPTEPSSEESKEPSNSQKPLYVAPALRRSQGDCRRIQSQTQLQPQPPQPSRIRKPRPQNNSIKGEAPDLNSAEFFPSLRVARAALKRSK